MSADKYLSIFSRQMEAIVYVFFSRELFLVAVHGWFAIRRNVWKCQQAATGVVAF